MTLLQLYHPDRGRVGRVTDHSAGNRVGRVTDLPAGDRVGRVTYHLALGRVTATIQSVVELVE